MPKALSLSYDQTPEAGTEDSRSYDQMPEGGLAETLNPSGKNSTKKGFESAGMGSHSSDRALEGGMTETLILSGEKEANESDRVAE
jgi:hypothetical protein